MKKEKLVRWHSGVSLLALALLGGCGPMGTIPSSGEDEKGTPDVAHNIVSVNQIAPPNPQGPEGADAGESNFAPLTNVPQPEEGKQEDEDGDNVPQPEEGKQEDGDGDGESTEDNENEEEDEQPITLLGWSYEENEAIVFATADLDFDDSGENDDDHNNEGDQTQTEEDPCGFCSTINPRTEEELKRVTGTEGWGTCWQEVFCLACENRQKNEILSPFITLTMANMIEENSAIDSAKKEVLDVLLRQSSGINLRNDSFEPFRAVRSLIGPFYELNSSEFSKLLEVAFKGSEEGGLMVIQAMLLTHNYANKYDDMIKVIADGWWNKLTEQEKSNIHQLMRNAYRQIPENLL